jgi:hypothetical protein
MGVMQNKEYVQVHILSLLTRTGMSLLVVVRQEKLFSLQVLECPPVVVKSGRSSRIFNYNNLKYKLSSYVYIIFGQSSEGCLPYAGFL